MKELLAALDKAFENRIRLGVMSALMVRDSISFNELKDMLDASDGNLATHLRQLEGKGYIEVQKSFIKRKPNTSYRATKLGRVSFQKHLTALEGLLSQRRKD